MDGRRSYSRANKIAVMGLASNREPLMVLRTEYISDGGEEEHPWLH